MMFYLGHESEFILAGMPTGTKNEQRVHVLENRLKLETKYGLGQECILTRA